VSTAGFSANTVKLWVKSTTVGASGGQRYTYAVSGAVPARIEQSTSGRVQRVFGLESQAEFIGLVDRGVAVTEGSILEIVTGPFAGRVLGVTGVKYDVDSGLNILSLSPTRERPA
jgi:hypothetical protein